MVMHGHSVTCYNRTGHHVSGKEYDIEHLDEYRGIRLKRVPTIDRKGLAAVTSSFFGCLAAAFGPYDVVHIHAEGPAMFSWLPRLTGKRVVLTVHGLDWARDKWKGSFVKQICPSNTAFSCFIHRFCKKCHSCPQWKSVFRHFIQIRAAFIRTPVRSLSVRVQEPSVLPHSGHRHLKSSASPVGQTLPLPPLSVFLQ